MYVQIEGYIDGTIVAPPQQIEEGEPGKKQMVPSLAYAKWLVRDQQVFSYLVASLHRDVLAQVASSVTAHELWQAIEAMFASQTRARAVNTCIVLATRSLNMWPKCVPLEMRWR